VQNLLSPVVIGLAVISILAGSTNSLHILFGAEELLEGLGLDWDPGPGIRPCRPPGEALLHHSICSHD
jgi:hypothetical protein